MIRFNWKSILKATKGDTQEIIWAIYCLMGMKPKNKFSPIYKYQTGRSLSGDSFLINPKDLLNDTKVNKYFICQYIYLASLRQFGVYLATGHTKLDIRLSPLSLEKIKQNPLLTVDTHYIYFKYEE